MKSVTNEQKVELMNARTDEGKAKLVSVRYQAQFTYNTAFGLMAWNGSYWIGGHDAEVRLSIATGETFTYLQGLAESSGWRQEDINLFATNYNKKQACKNEFIRLPEIASKPEDFNKYDDLLPVENGVIDLRTGELLPHDPKYRFTFVCPVEYKPQADTGIIEKFLGDSVEHYKDDSEVKEFVQKSLGYMLTGDTSQEIFFYVEGKPRSGKGTLTEMIQRMLGENIATARPFDSFSRDRSNGDQGFDIAQLNGKRIVIASESKKAQKLNSAVVKSLTGGDTITAAFKNKDTFTFRPKFKIMLLSNFAINADPDDEALWIRTRILRFPNGHNEETVDTSIKAGMFKSENLQALLAYMVQGSIMFYAEGKITQPEKLKAMKRERHLQLDTVQQWLEDRTEHLSVDAPNSEWTIVKDLFNSYEMWCTVNEFSDRETIVSRGSFTNSLQAKGYVTKRVAQGQAFNIRILTLTKGDN
jgi:putative DNA primase/helicase